MQTESRKKELKRLTDLVEGKVEPPNRYAAFLIDKIKGLEGEGQSIAQQLKFHRGKVEELETALTGVTEAGRRYVNDLREWDREDPDEDKVAAAEDGI